MLPTDPPADPNTSGKRSKAAEHGPRTAREQRPGEEDARINKKAIG